jgi:hypothetical protein
MIRACFIAQPSVSQESSAARLALQCYWIKQRRNDTQYNDIQHNDTQYNGIQHNDTQYNGIQHNDTIYNGHYDNTYKDFKNNDFSCN